jgi:hypothetical protein
MRSIRAKSLFIRFLLTSVSFPHGDDASSFAALHVADHYQPPDELT